MSVVIFFAVLGLMVVVHELGHFLAARACGIKVDVFSIGFGPTLYARKGRDCEFRLSAIPLGGYVSLHGDDPSKATGAADEFLRQPKRKRIAVIAAGPVFNFILAWVLFCGVYVVGYEASAPVIGGVMPDKPAAVAGLQKGDRISAVNAHAVETWQDVVTQVRSARTETLAVDVLRNGANVHFVVQPTKIDSHDILGKKVRVFFLGMEPSDETVRVKRTLGAAFIDGSRRFWVSSVLTVQGLWYTVTGALPFKESLTGPLGIYFITKKAIAVGLGAVLDLMAIISLSLAIFNLLPLPVLDGGHIFLLGVEALRRKPISDRFQEQLTNVGIGFIVLLTVFVLWNDVRKFMVASAKTDAVPATAAQK
jgi:regulator of sigma E protease